MTNKKIIASLASFPPRITTIHKVIESVLNQTVRLDKVILYLADKQFPGHNLPGNLIELMHGRQELEIRWWLSDIRSFKKLVPALIEFPDDIIVTFDDDIIYPADIVEKLMKKHQEYPDAICGCRVKLITVKNGEIEPYRKWHRYRTMRLLLSGTFPKFRNFATTGGGTLFPPHSLHPDAIRDDIFTELCPTTDDLWFWAMAVLNNTRTVPAMEYLSIGSITIKETQTETLANYNIRGEKLNDKNMKRILDFYPDLKSKIVLQHE